MLDVEKCFYVQSLEAGVHSSTADPQLVMLQLLVVMLCGWLGYTSSVITNAGRAESTFIAVRGGGDAASSQLTVHYFTSGAWIVHDFSILVLSNIVSF